MQLCLANSKKSQGQTPNSNSMNATKAYFCNEKLEQSVKNVNLTQQNFNSRQSHKNNYMNVRKHSEGSEIKHAARPEPL